MDTCAACVKVKVSAAQRGGKSREGGGGGRLRKEAWFWKIALTLPSACVESAISASDTSEMTHVFVACFARQQCFLAYRERDGPAAGGGCTGTETRPRDQIFNLAL